jgi:hypothetical protein
MKMSARKRSQCNTKVTEAQRGNTLLLTTLTVCFVVVPTFILVAQLALYQVDRARVQNIVEAAGLIAANDLAKIIIDDENFGFVALSNYPPIGKGALAEDGEPLPVTGINTLVGTVRQNTLIADELHNATMVVLAERDKERLDKTIKDLNKTLKAALDEKNRQQFNDMQGERIETTKDVITFIRSQLPDHVKLESVTLSNGWLSEGGDSTVAIPQPKHLAKIRPTEIRAGKYRAFSDVPVGGEHFSFAGLGTSSSLVDRKLFRPADEKHICSIIKISCRFKLNGMSKVAPFGLSTGSTLICDACCQPYSLPDSGPSGALTLRFSSGPVTGLQSWRDFLGGGFRDTKVTTYSAEGGDYPISQEAHMVPDQPLLPASTSAQFAEHLYNWLRNGHTRPNIDAVIAMVDESFKSGPNQIYAYEFAHNGAISRRIISKDPFPVGVTADSQMQTIADTNIQGGLAPIIIFRDDVGVLGRKKGGLHAGQPLAGNPLNWCELPEYGGDEHMAAGLGKGHLGTKLTMVDPNGTALPDEAINDPNFALFRSFDGKTLFHQPRRSFYSGGLALDIEIGGTGNSSMAAAQPPEPHIQQLPAILDIPSKRWIFANRRI